MVDFIKFPKISRFSREVIVTEKIDGTNSRICITETGDFLVGSKNRWITPDDDNLGFAKWAFENESSLRELGVGEHFGEWWGCGIQRSYEEKEKHFSLFNVSRWLENRPSCCNVVPVLWSGLFDDLNVKLILDDLKNLGSKAKPGFMRPEGIVIYHTAGNVMFKKTFEKDNTGKWEL